MSLNDSIEPHPQSPNLEFGPLTALVVSLLIGAALGVAFLSLFFKSIPTDVARLGVLTRALADQKPGPSLVVFGNSAMMSGFDANALRQFSPDAPLAWNCASTGQTLTEAALLTQELPDSVVRVVYALQLRAGPSDELIHPNKFNTFFMNGLRPTSDTTEMLRALGDRDLNDLLEESWLEQTLASRWAVRQLIDRTSRELLRSDLELERATIDLFHPQAYAKPIQESITTRFIAGRNEAYSEKSAMLPVETLDLARSLAELGAAAGRETIFIFPPSHPGMAGPNQAAFSKVIEDFRSELLPLAGTYVFSAIDLLPQSEFIDDMHPTDAGALRLTAHLARFFEKLDTDTSDAETKGAQ